jgi:hypothetical protein
MKLCTPVQTKYHVAGPARPVQIQNIVTFCLHVLFVPGYIIFYLYRARRAGYIFSLYRGTSFHYFRFVHFLFAGAGPTDSSALKRPNLQTCRMNTWL